MFSHFPYVSRSGVRIGVPYRIPVADIYPKTDLVLDLDSFVFTYVEVSDKSVEDNDAILYSARGVSLDGVGDTVDLPSVSASPITNVKVLAKSGSDTSVPLGDFGTGTIVANDTWQEVSVDTPAKDYGDKMWFDGVDDYVELPSSVQLDVGDYIEASSFWRTGDRLALFEDAPSAVDFIYITELSARFRLDGVQYIGTQSPISGAVNTVRLTRTSSTNYDLTLNGVTESFTTADAALVIRHFGGTDQVGIYFQNLLLYVDYNNEGYWINNGTSNSDWVDTIGSNDGTVNGSPETVSSYFSSFAESIGDGYTGELADVRLYNGTTLLDQAYLNEHTDTVTNSLNGLPLVTRNGNVGSYTGCAAVVQEGISDSRVAGLEQYSDQMWFNGSTDSVSVNTLGPVSTTYFGDCTFSATIKINREKPTSAPGSIWSFAGTSLYSLYAGSYEWRINGVYTGVPITDEVIDVELDFVGNAAVAFRINGVEVWSGSAANSPTIVNSDPTALFTFGAYDYFGIKHYKACFIEDFAITGANGFTWDGTITAAVSNGWDFSGVAKSIGQILKTPPQVLGMDFNRYGFLGDQVTDSWDSSSYDKIKGDLTLSATGTTDRFFTVALSGVTSDVVVVKGTCTSVTSSPSFNLRSATTLRSNVEPISSTGDFEITLTATGNFDRLAVSEGGADLPSDVTLTNLRIERDGMEYPLIPTSLSNSANDALGVAIANPRTSRTFNSDGSGYAEVADSASLDLTTEASWVIKGNFYQTYEVFSAYVSKYDIAQTKRSWLLFKEAGDLVDEFTMNFGTATGAFSGNAKWSGLTDEEGVLVVTYNAGTLKAYWKGVDLGAATIGGAIPSSLFTSDVPVRIAASEGLSAASGILGDPVSDIKIYNRVLTAEEISDFFSGEAETFPLTFPITLS